MELVKDLSWLSQHRVVFLDIDGVLNCGPYNHNSDAALDHSRYVDCELRQAFSYWARNHAIKIVGVSSWFCGSDDADIELVAGFLGLEIVAITDHCGGGYGRGTGVLDFVEKYQLEDWAVIDDAGAMMYAFPTVIINPRTGINKFDMENSLMMIDSGHCLLQDVPQYRASQISKHYNGSSLNV